MQIRNYKDEDFQQVDKLLKETGVKWYSVDNRENFRKKIKQDPESIIVAEEDGNIVGTIFVVYDPWSSFILHLAVDENHRKKGLGGILFQIVEQRLRTRDKDFAFGFIKEDNKEVLEYCKKKGYSPVNKVHFMSKRL